MLYCYGNVILALATAYVNGTRVIPIITGFNTSKLKKVHTISQQVFSERPGHKHIWLQYQPIAPIKTARFLAHQTLTNKEKLLRNHQRGTSKRHATSCTDHRNLDMTCSLSCQGNRKLYLEILEQVDRTRTLRENL